MVRKTMYWLVSLVALAAMASVFGGCISRNAKVSRLTLGMSPEEVAETIGRPFAIRAAKVYTETGETSQVWEYLPPVITSNPKTYWLYFENDKLVQWGEPGDFSGSPATAVKEYNPNKSAR